MRLFGSLKELVQLVIRTAGNKEVQIQSAAQSGTTPITVTIPDVGDSSDTFAVLDAAQSLTNKTVGNTNTVTLKDTLFTLQDDGDATKLTVFELSGITTGTTRTMTIPDASGTLTLLAATQTLTNKTLGSTNTITGATAASFTNTGTISLPTTTTTLVGRTTTDTGANRLQNKDLDDSTTNIVDEGDTSKKLNFSLGGAATATTMTFVSSATGNRSLTFPDTSDTMVARSTTDTLANKTLNNTNTVTLKDTLFTLQDDGDTAKQARFELSGITTGNTRIYTVPDASTTLVGIATTQVLTNKDYDGGTASNTSRVTLPKDTTTNINALTRKQATIIYDTTTDQVKFDNGTTLTALGTSTVYDRASDVNNVTVACSVASNALTIALKDKNGSDPTVGSPVQINFRSTTLTTGTYTTVSATGAMSLVVSSGSTLGQVNGGANYPVYVYLINNAGTLELAVSSNRFNENTLVSTTAEGGAGAADSVAVMYSTTARSNVAFRLIAVLNSNQTTVGTWAAVPTNNSPNFLNYIPVSTVTGDLTGAAVGPNILGENVGASAISNTSLTTNTTVNLSNIVLEPGTYEMHGQVRIGLGGTTVVQLSQASISSTSATIDNANLNTQGNQTAGNDHAIQVFRRVTVTSTTTYYFVARCTFTTSTADIQAANSYFYAIRTR